MYTAYKSIASRVAVSSSDKESDDLYRQSRNRSVHRSKFLFSPFGGRGDDFQSDEPKGQPHVDILLIKTCYHLNQDAS